jgi:hypothetical protein
MLQGFFQILYGERAGTDVEFSVGRGEEVSDYHCVCLYTRTYGICKSKAIPVTGRGGL